MTEEKKIYIMKHCIGLDYSSPYHRHGKAFYRPYRNYYDAGGDDIPRWEQLVKEGLAYKIATYHLTYKGFEWLGIKLGIHIYPKDAE